MQCHSRTRANQQVQMSETSRNKAFDVYEMRSLAITTYPYPLDAYRFIRSTPIAPESRAPLPPDFLAPPTLTTLTGILLLSA